LIFEKDPTAAYRQRIDALERAARKCGVEGSRTLLRLALDRAWLRHYELWHAGEASGPEEIANWCLEELSLCDQPVAAALASDLSEIAISCEITSLESAGLTLERLASAGVRRALICDTGFTPGRVVRRLLQREGLLDLLEVQVFSDEFGVPKPCPTIFHAALALVDASPESSVHVGDMRRTDVAGAREAGMSTVRIAHHHDDRSEEHPEANHVADTHAHLRALLGIDNHKEEE
jgi:putative hydrolase of the HAD superfamily